MARKDCENLRDRLDRLEGAGAVGVDVFLRPAEVCHVDRLDIHGVDVLVVSDTASPVNDALRLLRVTTSPDTLGVHVNICTASSRYTHGLLTNLTFIGV